MGESCTLPCDQALLAANVFLVWSSVDQGIEKATDTFMWKDVNGVVKVKKQNIVATQPSACTGGETLAAPAADPNNHLAGFGSQDKQMIMEDYLESSTVQVFTWDKGYEIFEGLDAIGGMFEGLWADMNGRVVDGSIGLGIPGGFPRVEVGMQSVFLTWH